MVYRSVVEMCRLRPEFIIVRQEDLSLEPVENFRMLYDRLGLVFTRQVEKLIRSSSSSENPIEPARGKTHSTRLDSRAAAHSWKARLAADEIRRIRDITADVSHAFYSDSDWG